MTTWYTTAHVPFEWSFRAEEPVDNPMSIEMDVRVRCPSGAEVSVPAYWAGGSEWRVRIAVPVAGRYAWRTVCNPATGGLDGVTGEISAEPYEGNHPLLRHGGLRVPPGSRHLVFQDGTPFFWLADTWWMGLCRRMRWPDQFQALTASRASRGFSVVQIVAGLYPDMPAFDPRGANEAGFPWEPDWSAIRPAYFDHADLRIAWLVRAGIVPCIVGCWAYYIDWLGVKRMRQHWRHIVARWGAWPVVWCLAGETRMPYYLQDLPTPEARAVHVESMSQRWSEVARYIHQIDGHRRPLTTHPTCAETGRQSVDDQWVDFDMLQTGHGDRQSLPSTCDAVERSYSMHPRKPVINGEVCYEGIGEASRQEVQRLMFWACMLSGAAGHTYGANGIWQVNEPGRPYGPSPHGMTWGNTPWPEAAELPGARQLGLARRMLERYRWWLLQPTQSAVEPHSEPNSRMQPWCASIPHQVRIIYVPVYNPQIVIRSIETDATYTASWWNPCTGEDVAIGPVTADHDGAWRPSPAPIYQDWVLVLETPDARVIQTAEELPSK